MKKEYDFSKGIRNPYAKRLKRPITIRVEIDTLEYFKRVSAQIGLPYQKLINLYLRDCAESGKKPALKWISHKAAA
jgi:predicted DNA binding CopG/RHH family protein